MRSQSWFSVYKLLILTTLRSRMQYKFNFVFGSLMAAVVQINEFLMVAIVLYKFGEIKGWSLYEIGYLYAVLTLARTLYRTFGDEVHHLEKYLVSGDLDGVLIRPLPVLLALMPQGFRPMVGEVLQGGFVLVWAFTGLMSSGQIDWTAIPLTLFIIVAGAVILFAIGLATATMGFWTTRISELQNLTEDAARAAAQYPLTLYPKWLSGILLTVIPVGLVNYIPALYILRGELGLWAVGLTGLAAGLFLLLSLWFWRFGLTKYQSTGS